MNEEPDRKRVPNFLIFVFFAFLIAGCSKPVPVQNAILGKWLSTGNPDLVFEFFKDSTCRVTTKDDIFHGAWIRVTNDRISFDLMMNDRKETLVLSDIQMTAERIDGALNGEPYALTRID